jgi:hypothetical protein
MVVTLAGRFIITECNRQKSYLLKHQTKTTNYCFTIMSKHKLIKPENTDPIKEAISHPDGPSLEEMIYGKEEKNRYPNPNEKAVAEDKLGKLK